ncbi:serine/threonine-protein kinase Nek2 [Periplaneta americana]|uniref:serine/threonine-protein kinase Nek2 n=1 Tax=Periplaneta americana TaxID=6978 RepID=UPI0037E919D6
MSGRVEDYEVLNIIGTGSFGTCYKVQKKSNGQLYVWKAVNYGGMSEDKKQLLVSEVNLLSELRHANIVQYYDRIIHKETATLYIVMEWCQGGDLASLINKCKKSCSYLDEGFVWRVLYQMCRALQACHWHLSNCTVLHRDIKPANVFLDGTGNVKLGDFGLARILHSDNSYAQTLVGTPYYMSPEVIKGGKYNKKSDIWSLGCLVYELCSLTTPFTGSNVKQLALKIKGGKFSRIPAHYSDQLQKIISLLLSVEHKFRPTIEMILHHPTVVSHIAQETFKSMIVNDKSNTLELCSKSKDDLSDIDKDIHDLHVDPVSKPPLQDEKENETIKEKCSENVRDIWLSRFHILKQREAALRMKELTIDERERALAKKEKQVALLDRLTKDKMTRADIYLRQCREARSVASSVKNIQQQRHSTIDADLDTTVSADPGDTSILPTSTKLNPECVAKPSPFVRVGSERHVHFDTLPKVKAKVFPTRQPAILDKQPREALCPLKTSNKTLYSIQEHAPSAISQMHKGNKVHEKSVKSSVHDLKRAEEDNFRNNVLAVLNSDQLPNMMRPPSRTTSWTEERTMWLENKRHAYHLIGTLRAHKTANKENAVPQSMGAEHQKAVPHVPKTRVGSLLSFR